MTTPDDACDDDDALARRLRRAADGFRPQVPGALAERTLATVVRDRQRQRGWWRIRAWRPLVAAALVAAAVLGLALAPERRALAASSLVLSIPLSPWQTLPESPLTEEWRHLRADAGRAAQVLVACLPGTVRTPGAPDALEDR